MKESHPHPFYILEHYFQKVGGENNIFVIYFQNTDKYITSQLAYTSHLNI